MATDYKDFRIEVFDDESYTPNSTDNINSYKIEYIESNDEFGINQHGIRIFKDETEISSAIICEHGGGTGTHKNSYLIKDNSIRICCGFMIYSLNIPILELDWKKQLDMATCFGIYEFEDDYIIHGELEISRLTKSGDIKWQFSGRDIFVNINGKKEFEIIGKTIKLIDFGNYEYVIDENGKEIK